MGIIGGRSSDDLQDEGVEREESEAKESSSPELNENAEEDLEEARELALSRYEE